MKQLIVLALIALSACSLKESELSINASEGSVRKHLGEPMLIAGERRYWCREGEYGIKHLLMARFTNGYLVEALQNQLEYSGECVNLIDAWAYRFEMNDQKVERW